MQPIDAHILTRECVAAGVPLTDVTLESGGDDLPQAFRHIPIKPEHLCFNIVAVRNPTTGEWRFQIARALLFGFSASVIQFGRWSAFLQAVQRRILALLLSMYVDDSNLTDVKQAGGLGQEASRSLCSLLGTPVAEEKSRDMVPSGDFLGVVHQFGPDLDCNVIKFWPREKLIEKALSLISEHRTLNNLAPADASKLRGILGFIARPAWHGVG